nr:immunoglobulin light chain junction region [Macaca mulatta]MOX28298.1 immunoglobulin light chain junction region [Macaca mulatta]MOX31708.1 immunoglobulin light chain junction region [Macaca mulatta]
DYYCVIWHNIAWVF